MTDTIKKILIDDSHTLFNTQGMFFKEFPSDLRQLKFFTGIIMQKAPLEIKGRILLEKQISELIKNAIKHGNKLNPDKKVRIHFAFNMEKAHLIISDEGAGFTELEQWNHFYQQQRRCYEQQNFDEIRKYTSFRTPTSSAEDEGQALFQAIDFWNGGIIFNSGRNNVAVLKIYPRKNQGISLR